MKRGAADERHAALTDQHRILGGIGKERAADALLLGHGVEGLVGLDQGLGIHARSGTSALERAGNPAAGNRRVPRLK